MTGPAAGPLGEPGGGMCCGYNNGMRMAPSNRQPSRGPRAIIAGTRIAGPPRGLRGNWGRPLQADAPGRRRAPRVDVCRLRSWPRRAPFPACARGCERSDPHITAHAYGPQPRAKVIAGCTSTAGHHTEACEKRAPTAQRSDQHIQSAFLLLVFLPSAILLSTAGGAPPPDLSAIALKMSVVQ